MKNLVLMSRWLGRKFLFCAGIAALILIGSVFGKPGIYGEACAALVAVAWGYCGGNVAGKKYGGTKEAKKEE